MRDTVWMPGKGGHAILIDLTTDATTFNAVGLVEAPIDPR